MGGEVKLSAPRYGLPDNKRLFWTLHLNHIYLMVGGIGLRCRHQDAYLYFEL